MLYIKWSDQNTCYLGRYYPNIACGYHLVSCKSQSRGESNKEVCRMALERRGFVESDEAWDFPPAHCSEGWASRSRDRQGPTESIPSLWGSWGKEPPNHPPWNSEYTWLGTDWIWYWACVGREILWEIGNTSGAVQKTKRHYRKSQDSRRKLFRKVISEFRSTGA